MAEIKDIANEILTGQKDVQLIIDRNSSAMDVVLRGLVGIQDTMKVEIVDDTMKALAACFEMFADVMDTNCNNCI